MSQPTLLVRSARAALSALLLTASPVLAGSSYQPLEVDGTWVGTLTCKGITSAGTPTTFGIELTEVRMQTASNGQLAVEIDAQGGVRGFGTNGLCGSTTVTGGEPNRGNVVFSPITIFGGVTVDLHVPIQAATFKGVKLYTPKNGISGKMKGVAVSLPGSGIIGQCKVKLKRTSDVAPTMNTALLDDCGVSLR